MDLRFRSRITASVIGLCFAPLALAGCQQTPQSMATAPVFQGVPTGGTPAVSTRPVGTGGTQAPVTGGSSSLPVATPGGGGGASAPPTVVGGGASTPPVMNAGTGATAAVGKCHYTRKNAKNLSAAERAAFVAAVLKLKEMPSPYDSTKNYYDQFVQWHIALQYCDPKATKPMMMGHGAPMFLPWHREHLILFDQALEKVSPEVRISVPYWDWTDQDLSKIFSDDFMGSNGDRNQNGALMSGPFKKDVFVVKIQPPGITAGGSAYVQRFMGSPAGLPKPEEVTAALKVPHYDTAPWDLNSDPQQSFRNNLEGNIGMGSFFGGGTGAECPSNGIMPLPIGGMTLHNRIHAWVSGSMLTAASPNDPVFWLHHTNTDRIWYEWQKIHGIDTYEPVKEYENNNLDDEMIPFDAHDIHVTPKDVLDSDKLGVCYE